jgi:hypothetical protein
MTKEDQYGKYFAELIGVNILTLLEGGATLTKNYKGPHKTIRENRLRKHISEQVRDRRYVSPSHWPRLEIERSLANDNDHGGVDYFFHQSPSSKLDLKDALATCELKGPARQRFSANPKRTGTQKFLAISKSNTTGQKGRRARGTISALLLDLKTVRMFARRLEKNWTKR